MDKVDIKELRLGNFIVGHSTENEQEWMCIRSIVGNWQMRYREDDAMYGKILEMMQNDEYHVLLRYFVNMNFIIASILPDGEFVKDFFVAFNNYTQRVVEGVRELTREEQDGHIEDVTAIVGLQKELDDIIQSASKTNDTSTNE